MDISVAPNILTLKINTVEIIFEWTSWCTGEKTPNLRVELLGLGYRMFQHD